MAGRWAMTTPIPEEAKGLVVLDAEADAEKIAGIVDFVFCAVDMKKEEIRALEEKYARLECPVVSNNSAHRWTEDVPMVVPEINADHIRLIDQQRKRLGTKRGFVAVKSNCSLQSYVPALHPLLKYGLDRRWYVPIRQSPALEKPLTVGLRWWITVFLSLAARRKKVRRNP